MKIYVNVSPEFKKASYGRDEDFTVEAGSIEAGIGKAVRMFRVRFREKNRGRPNKISEMSVRAKIVGG